MQDKEGKKVLSVEAFLLSHLTARGPLPLTSKYGDKERCLRVAFVTQ